MSKEVDRIITQEELAKHNTYDSLWVAINGGVYDVTKFAKLHPGGRPILLTVGGQDQTEQFYGLHTKSQLQKYQRLKIGKL